MSESEEAVTMIISDQIKSYLQSKKLLIRDSFIVLFQVVVTIVYLIVVVVMKIDLAPGSSYLKSVLMNFLIPLLLIGILGLVYSVILVTDVVRIIQAKTITKVLLSLGVWFLSPIVYITKIMVYISAKTTSHKTEQVS